MVPEGRKALDKSLLYKLLTTPFMSVRLIGAKAPSA